MHPNDGRVVSNFIIQALKGEDITIYGDGSQTRSFCYVDDTVDGIIRMMNTHRGYTGPVNLGNPNEISIFDLARLIIDLTGSESRIVFKPLPQDDPRRRCPDITLAREKLGWKPTIDLKTGLKKTLEYFSSFIDYHKTTYAINPKTKVL